MKRTIIGLAVGFVGVAIVAALSRFGPDFGARAMATCREMMARGRAAKTTRVSV